MIYLLDTTHCSRIMEGDAAILERLRDNASIVTATSVIVQGELVFMARKSEQTSANLSRVERFLQGIRIYPVDGETAIRYGGLKADLIRHFGPKEKSKRRRVTLAQLGFGDNDLWIAATALRHGLTVVSHDGDFQRMREAQDFPLEAW